MRRASLPLPLTALIHQPGGRENVSRERVRSRYPDARDPVHPRRRGPRRPGNRSQHHGAQLPARAPAPHRHQGGLRRGRLRRLHGRCWPSCDGDRVRFRAINSCIKFLPTLDGKELLTVESLRAADGSLHPVQRAMVDCHGSQCGFCTPGFVMSHVRALQERGAARRARGCTMPWPATCAAAPATGRSSTPRSGCTTTATAATATGCDAPIRPRPTPSRVPRRRAMVERLRSIQRDGTLAVTGPDLAGGERRYFAPRSLDDLARLVEAHPDATHPRRRHRRRAVGHQVPLGHRHHHLPRRGRGARHISRRPTATSRSAPRSP